MRRALAFAALALAACTEGGGGPRPDAGAGGNLDGASSIDAPASDAPFTRPDSNADRPFEACGSTASADPLPATLMFLIDTSGSMNCGTTEPTCAVADPGDAPESRYDVLREQLTSALGLLPDTTTAGLMNYPGAMCRNMTPRVALAPLGTSRATIVSELGAISPTGVTPTHPAVMTAFGVLDGSTAENRFLVLATDGRASMCLDCTGCDDQNGDNEDMVDNIGDAADRGIRTFVIGVPGAQGFRDILSRMAQQGGTAPAGCSPTGPSFCHFDLTDATTDFGTRLRDALAAIGEAVVSCEYDIPENPDGTIDITRVNVILDGESGRETIPRDVSHANGWDYADGNTKIVIHGAACDRAKVLPGGRITVQFGCTTILI